VARRRCLDFPAVGCAKFTVDGSRCAGCVARRKAVRNAGAQAARDLIGRSPRSAQSGDTDDLTADHVFPLATGGTNTGPRQVLTRAENTRKGGGQFGPVHVYRRS
jgi:hypothetical protein